MAFADPQSVTLDAANSLPRTGQDISSGSFTKNDQTVSLSIRHSKPSKAGVVTSSVQLTQYKVVADPLLTGTNLRLQGVVTLSLRRPKSGFTVAECVQLLTGLSTWGTASTNANFTKFVGLES